MASSVEQEMKELEEAFHFGGFISFFLAIAIGCFLNKMCPRFKWDQSPPGPAEFRGVGNLHQVARGNCTLAKIQRWREIYGDVIALSLGQYKMVILSGYETIKQAFNTPQFSQRRLIKPFHAPVVKLRDLGIGTMLPNDKDVVRRLKNFSAGNVSESVIVHQNVTDLLITMKKLQGQHFVPHKIMTESVVKSLSSVALGKMMGSEREDGNFQIIWENVQTIMSSTRVSSGPGFFLSTLLPKFTSSIEKAKNFVLGNCQEDIIDELVHCEKSGFISSTITDAYLMDIDDLQKNLHNVHSKENSHIDKNVGDILNVLAAASESSSNMLIWALYYLIKHPQAQQQLYEEVYLAIGKSRVPSLDDLDLCPFTQACIEEVFRITSLAPLGYYHQTCDDVMFQGHFIPKDTLICSNIYALHNDKRIWGDPQSFRPDRFLVRCSSSGKNVFKSCDTFGQVMPFSVSRTTLGEMVTRNCTFLYVTSLIQKFTFSCCSSSGGFHKNIEPGTDLVRGPKEFRIVARERCS